jgi:hypothetical protein
MGEVPANRCQPAFAGEFGRLKDALAEICAGLGVVESPADLIG